VITSEAALTRKIQKHRKLLCEKSTVADRRYRLPLTQPPLQLFVGDHETSNRLALDESVHNLPDVREGDAPVKKMVGFD